MGEDLSKESDIEAVEAANRELPEGWLLQITEWVRDAGMTVVGVASFRWVKKAKSWVLGIQVKDVTGPNQFENRRLLYIKMPWSKKD